MRCNYNIGLRKYYVRAEKTKINEKNLHLKLMYNCNINQSFVM